MSDSSAPPPQTPNDVPQGQPDATAPIQQPQPTRSTGPQAAGPDPSAARPGQPGALPEGSGATPAGRPFGPPPPGVHPAGFGQPVPPRRGIRGLWREATSTTGGRVATVIAAVFVLVVVLGAIGLGAVAIGRMGDNGGRSSVVANRGQGNLPVPGRPGLGRGQGRPGFGDDEEGGAGRLPGLGGGLARGLGPLGTILHGELVTGGSSGTTILYQVGTVTAYTKGSSLAVKSSDGFATTYKVDTNSHLVGSTSRGITVGDTVRVIATKAGPTVTTVQIVGQGAGSGLSNGVGA